MNNVIQYWMLSRHICLDVPIIIFHAITLCDNSLTMLLCLHTSQYNVSLFFLIYMAYWLFETCHDIDCRTYIFIYILLCVRDLQYSPHTLTFKCLQPLLRIETQAFPTVARATFSHIDF